MSNQIDTTSEAGWDACVKAYYNGEEMEFYVTNTNQWKLTSTHPSNWRHDIDFRIKPAHVPEGHDVWEDKHGFRFSIISIREHSDCFDAMWYEDGDMRRGHIDRDSLFKFIGKIDLRLLKGGEDE